MKGQTRSVSVGLDWQRNASDNLLQKGVDQEPLWIHSDGKPTAEWETYEVWAAAMSASHMWAFLRRASLASARVVRFTAHTVVDVAMTERGPRVLAMRLSPRIEMEGEFSVSRLRDELRRAARDSLLSQCGLRFEILPWFRTYATEWETQAA